MTDSLFTDGDERVFNYCRQRIDKPMRGLGDSVHSIHRSTEFEGELRFSDLCDMVSRYRKLLLAAKKPK